MGQGWGYMMRESRVSQLFQFCDNHNRIMRSSVVMKKKNAISKARCVQWATDFFLNFLLLWVDLSCNCIAYWDDLVIKDTGAPPPNAQHCFPSIQWPSRIWISLFINRNSLIVSMTIVVRYKISISTRSRCSRCWSLHFHCHKWSWYSG